MCINRKKKERNLRKDGESMANIIRYPVVGTHSSAHSAIHAIPACSRYKCKIPKLTEPCGPSSRVPKSVEALQ
jgi:hypothetical protein